MTFLRQLLAIATFEARLNRRKWRVWILGTLALAVGALFSAQTFAIYRFFGGFSASYAFVARDLWQFVSGLYTAILVGLVGVFFAFDWRHQDESQHFEATWDASPVGRLALAWGRFLGLAAVLVVPFLVLGLIQLAVCLFGDVPMRPSVFFASLVEYGFLRSLAAVAVAFGLAGLTGSRALAVVGALAWLIGGFVVGFLLPEWVGMLVGGIRDFPVHSDFVGYDRTALSLVQTFSVLAFTVLFVTLGAVRRPALPRSAAARGRVLLVAGALLVLWAGLALGALSLYRSGLESRRRVLAAEREAVDLPVPTVVRRDLEVTLEPTSRHLAGRAVLGLRNDTGAPLAVLPFRLNTGLDISEVSDATGPVASTRAETIVRVTPREPLPPGAELVLTFEYAGGLEPTAVDASNELRTAEQPAQMRGNRRLASGRGVVYAPGALAAGLDSAWYPEPGTAFGHVPPSWRRRSFAPGSLVVRAPSEWTVASAGRREREGAAWRFIAEEPVPGFSLNAARYEELEAEVAGIRLRLLHHRAHGESVAYFAPAWEGIETTIAERLEEVRVRTGLSYPYPELTLVEVPQQLGTFGPGWDTTNQLAAPGIVMVHEGSPFSTRSEFPLRTARQAFRESGGRVSARAGDDGVSVSVRIGGGDEAGGDRDGGKPAPGADAEVASEAEAGGEAPPGEGATPVTRGSDEGAAGTGAAKPADLGTFDEARAKLEVLVRFLDTDWSGGHVQRLALRGFWDFRLQAVGPGTPVIGPGLSSFVAEQALGHYSVDTPEFTRIFNSPSFQRIIAAQQQGRDEEVAEILVSGIVDLDEVYEVMQERPLADIDPDEDPVTFLGITFLKVREPLRALADTLGRERFAAVLGGLAAEHGGGHFEWPDFRAAVLAQARPEEEEGLSTLLDGWLTGTELPGFVVETVTARRLAGEDERWQVLATVANRGQVAGTAKLVAGQGDGERSRLLAVAPGERVEVGVVTKSKPGSWRLAPYLALNRQDPGGSPKVDEAPLLGEPFEGVRPAPPDPDRPVVVDNLDAGFVVVVAGGKEVAYGDTEDDGDERVLRDWQGFRPPSEWSRWRSRGVWYRPHGLFDETAVVRAATDDGGHPARWRAELPEAGDWRVEAYLPPKGQGLRKTASPYLFTVRGAAGPQTVGAEIDSATPGWRDLGVHGFSSEAVVELDDKGEGVVVADAVRFVKER